MSQNIQICDVSEETLKMLKVFRLRKAKNKAAMLLKVDPNDLTIKLDETFEDIVDLEDLAEEIPFQEPRFLVYSGIRDHGDGRISYPLCLIFISPRGCKPEQQMMYAGSFQYLAGKSQISKVLELRDIEDDLNEEWLETNLKKSS